jgi:hypothetical protein
LEALDQPAGLGGGKGLVEGGLGVDVEVVLEEDDGRGVGEVEIGQVLEDVGVIHRGVAPGESLQVNIGACRRRLSR